MYINTSNPKY